MKSIAKEFVKQSVTPVAFHVQDEKGRWIGCNIYMERAVLEAAPEDCKGGYYQREAGEWFIATVQMTKDGKAWGASQAGSWFKTPEDRAAYIEKTVAARRKAAQKKFPVAA